MAIVIDNYMTNCGVQLEHAYLAITSFQYDILNKTLSFNISTYASKEAKENQLFPIEQNIIQANTKIDIDENTMIIPLIYNLVLQKINNVTEKTIEEIIEHNNNVDLSTGLDYWQNMWDISYQHFIGAYLETEEE